MGDRELARRLVIRGLREIADEIEEQGCKPRVWRDPVLKIPLMKTD